MRKHYGMSPQEVVILLKIADKKGMEFLIPSLPQACELEQTFYALVSLTETLRIGRSREVAIAIEELKQN